MASTRIASIAALALWLATFSLSSVAASQLSQNHIRYRLIDLGTFGGPNSLTQEELHVLNNRGMVAGWADTSIPNHPNACIFCDDSFITHAFQWQGALLFDLGALPGVNSSGAYWISESGLSAGYSESIAMDPVLGIRQMHATLWKSGEIIDLGTLGGGYESVAFTVNDRGQVAGTAINTVPDPFFGFQQRVFLWEHGVMRDLGTLGGPDAGLLGFKGNVEINERGDVTACSYTSSTPNPVTKTPTLDPFLWKNGRMIDLGTLGGTSGCSINLNDRSQVVGYSNLHGDLAFHPFLWDRGVIMDLGTLGGSWGFANSIDDSGDIGGAAAVRGDQHHHAFLWRSGIMTDLGTLPGDSCSSVIAINSEGDVVGQSFPCNGNNFHAFLRENGGTMLDLRALIAPNLDVNFVDAVGINDREEIAAWGALPNGDIHAMMLVPCHAAAECENTTMTRNYQLRSFGHMISPVMRRTPIDPIIVWRERLAARYHIPGLARLIWHPNI